MTILSNMINERAYRQTHSAETNTTSLLCHW